MDFIRGLLRPIFLTLFLAILCSCSLPASWTKTNNVDCPWRAPGIKAKAYTRPVQAVFMSDHVGNETAYGDDGFRSYKIEQEELTKELDKYFRNCEFIKKWSPTGSRIDNIIVRNSPYDLYLVSITPTIIVGVSKNTLSQQDNFYFQRIPLRTYHLSDEIIVTTSIPYRTTSEIIWLFPKRDNELHCLDLANGTAFITINGNDKISFVINKGVLHVTR